MADKHKDAGLVVLAVNAWDEDRATLRRFADKSKLKHRILLNGADVHSRYGDPGVPATLWIDRKGIVVDVLLGFDGPQELERKTKLLIKGG